MNTQSQHQFQPQVDALIRLVGARVRAARSELGLSRQALSDRSGVSPRYLAQLESGAGNISIGLLKRVAMALDKPIESLIAGDASQSADVAQVSATFAQADPATQAKVRHLLDPKRLQAEKAGRICLIGLRGAGKSTLGLGLAEALGVPFIELNREIEKFAGIPTAELIALYGEEGYRQFEADTLGQVIARHEAAVLAVAGGIVESEASFAQVLGRCHTVWLKAMPAEHMERVRTQGDLRPMAGNPQAMIQLRAILKRREVAYAKAAMQLDTSGKPVGESLAELRALLRANEVIA